MSNESFRLGDSLLSTCYVLTRKLCVHNRKLARIPDASNGRGHRRRGLELDLRSSALSRKGKREIQNIVVALILKKFSEIDRNL